GQHRSVFMAETLAQRFSGSVTTLLRHRELDAAE
ncbi:MAG TPA: RNase adaptor protein RapZ, partial [Burkholderiaceae bacterium]